MIFSFPLYSTHVVLVGILHNVWYGIWNKNLAIVDRSRVSCAHNTLGIYKHNYYTVTLKSRLNVTQGHWKWNHWIDHTRLSSKQASK